MKRREEAGGEEGRKEGRKEGVSGRRCARETENLHLGVVGIRRGSKFGGVDKHEK